MGREGLLPQHRSASSRAVAPWRVDAAERPPDPGMAIVVGDTLGCERRNNEVVRPGPYATLARE